MNWSQEFLDYTQRQLKKRMSSFGGRREEIENTLAGCGQDEKVLLSYYYATLPLTDVGDYPPALFLETARQALRVREEFSWCAALPEHLFLRTVAYPRINTEELEDCRGLFYEKIAPRLSGLSLPEAILEVNRWCAEEATYRSTDGRTASALQVFTRGFGRCGEESTFLVTALRSVGIAARQVYAPWWSHCDDNHAWVEAFDGKAWRYLGACEPEPVLDRGWFTHASARAVMVHTRSFVQGSREETAFLFPDTDPVDLDCQEGVAVENLTARYGTVKELSLHVVKEDDSPASGAWVSLSVMNMAAPREFARRRADAAGNVTLRLGKGSVLVTVWMEEEPDSLGETLLAPEDREVTVVLGSLLEPAGEGDLLAPADAGLTVPVLSPAQEETRRVCLDHAAALREEKRRRREAQRPAPPQGNLGRVWDSLTEKDREGDISPQLLEDSLAPFAWEKEFPPEVFQEGLLSPRIGLEVLTPWHKVLEEGFTSQQRGVFQKDPTQLWQWMEEHAALDGNCYSALWGTPEGMLRAGAGTQLGRVVLYCAACRALGIPAKLVDGVPQVWDGQSFSPLWGERLTGKLTLSAPHGQPGLAEQNYTLSRRGPEGFQVLSTRNVEAGETRELSLAPGEYRLWTVSRMPGGNQLARWETFFLKEGEPRELALSFREGDVQDLLERCPLPGFSLTDQQGGEVSGKGLLESSSLTVLCFLEVGREPTEHLLNELREAAGELEKTGVPLCLVLPDLSCMADGTLQKALKVLPWARILTADFAVSASPIARRLYLDPDQLPLAVLANREGEGLYGCCGYNVGTAALLLRLIKGLGDLALS